MAVLRKLEVADEKAWEKLLKELSAEKIVQIGIRKLVSDPNFHGLVLEENDTAIGFGSISFYQSSFKGRVGVIEDIIVNKKFRGKGLGTMLFDALLKEGEARDVCYITLTSNPKKAKARAIYASRGFVLCDTGFFAKEGSIFTKG